MFMLYVSYFVPLFTFQQFIIKDRYMVGWLVGLVWPGLTCRADCTNMSRIYGKTK